MHAALSRGCSRQQPIPIPKQHESQPSPNISPPCERVPEGREEQMFVSFSYRLCCSVFNDSGRLTDYELVKIYHPDSVVARAYPPEVSQARFHAISKAYDVLRGRRLSLASEDEGPTLRNDYHDLSSAIWRAKQRQRADDLYVPHDDRWKDRIILGAVVVALGVLVLQTNLARRKSINEMAHPYPNHPAAPSEKLTRKTSKSDEDLLAAPEDDVSLPEKAQPAS
ncbi:hypothetical protein EWM64_g5581 [Hericium alpestre]|uniref:J domain-containing protein n=1 Tax=Hericium alpestre TaxID=135208 RepID=A0A4Y9ZWI3_9AGAM|nr:hypothetical protein EWM64_g5581 [Hericium alpestre]